MVRDSKQHVRLAAIAVIAGSASGLAAQSRPVPAPETQLAAMLEDVKVVSAIKAAWRSSGNGASQMEAGFRLDGSPYDYQVVAFRRTNEFNRLTFQIIPGDTFIVFHVHSTAGDPDPSPADKRIADKYNFRIVSVHLRGLYDYSPATKKTTLIGNLPALLSSAPGESRARRKDPSPDIRQNVQLTRGQTNYESRLR